MRKLLIMILPLVVSACYDGKPSHPLDCALGLTLWAGYCPQPGTAGYEREQALKPQQATMSWNAPAGQTSIGFAKDKYSCMQDARSNVAGGSVIGGLRLTNGMVLPGRGSSFSREAIDQPLFAACMESKGYQQQSQ
jgi:hypothetical protein